MKRFALCCYSIGFIWLSTADVRAEEGELGLSVSGMFSPSVQSRMESGLGLRVDGEWGLAETWSLMAGAMWLRHGSGTEENACWLAGVDVGFQAKLDMLIVVPVFQLGLGWLGRQWDADGLDWGMAARAAVGLDYLWRENWWFGTNLAWEALLSDPDTLPRYLTISLTLGYRWLR